MAWTAKELVVSCLATVIHFSGLTIVTRPLTRSKIPILTYHSVGASEGDRASCLDLSGMRVTPREFRKQMQYVTSHFNTVSLEEVLRSRSNESALPPHPCVITFDDGYLDAYENAVPVLEELGLKATFFVIGRPTAGQDLPWLHAIDEILDTVSTPRCLTAFQKAAPPFFVTGGVSKDELRRQVRRYFDEQDRPTRIRFLDNVRTELGREAMRAYRFLEAAQIRELHGKGFEIGCHSMEHECMARLSDDELLADIRQCKEVLGGILCRPPTAFCYPFGGKASFDNRVIYTLKQEGFVCAATTISGLNDHSTDAFTLYRIGVYTGTNFPLFVFRLLGLETALRRFYRFFKSAFQQGESSDGQ